MKPDCGCDKSSAAPREYLMVEASASSANACANPSAEQTLASSCPKQEPVFDIILSGFILPEQGGNINVSVCNVLIYTEGMYIGFPSYGITMLVESIDITNRSLSLKNACRNGNSLGNPAIGTGVTKNSFFIPVPQPLCISSSEGNASITAALSTMTELCVPALTSGGSSAVYSMVGRIESDPNDTAQGKCIRQVSGFGFQDGAPVTPSIQLIPDADNFLYRDVAERKTSGAYRYRATPGEWTGTIANGKYVMAGSKTAYKSVGPVLLYSPFLKLFEEKNTALNQDTYTALANNAVMTKDFSVAIPEITGILNKDLQDYFYLHVHVIVGMFGTSAGNLRYLQVELNNQVIGYCSGTGAGINNFLNIVYPVKILNVTGNFNFKITAKGGNGIKYYYKVTGVGVSI